MQFTYTSYLNLLKKLKSHGYEIADYHNWMKKRRCVILRHDIDFSIDRAVKMAEFEAENGIFSTYFVIVTSGFYNIHSRDCREKLREICRMGHEAGVHYDETAYMTADPQEIVKNILYEGRILSDILGHQVNTVSMHRPGREILEMNLDVPGFVNSYSDTFFHKFKYVSDSGRKWREPVEKYIEHTAYERLHILTHAFWYENTEQSLQDTIKSFVNRANNDRYNVLDMNFTSLGTVMGREEIL